MRGTEDQISKWGAVLPPPAVPLTEPPLDSTGNEKNAEIGRRRRLKSCNRQQTVDELRSTESASAPNSTPASNSFHPLIRRLIQMFRGT